VTDFFEDSLAPDMPSLPADVVQRLERLAQSEDLDERALALASLHLARGEDTRVRRFFASELGRLDSLDDPIRRRWSIALGFVADRYRQQGDPARAIVTYRKALEIRPNEPGVLLNLGLALAEAGDFANAIETYRRSLAADPAQPLAHVNWGIALESLGDTAGGVAEFRRALAADPAVLCAALRRRRARVRGRHRRLLADAVRGDGAARQTLGQDRPPTRLADDDARERGGLHAVCVRGLVLGAVSLARGVGVCGRQHLGGTGVHGRHHDACRALARHGNGGRRVRHRVQPWAGDR